MPKIIKDFREVYNVFNNEIPEKLKDKKRYGRIRVTQAISLLNKSEALKDMFSDFYIDTVKEQNDLKLYVIYCYSKHFKKCNDMENPPLYSIIFKNVPRPDVGFDIVVSSVQKAAIQ